MHHTYLDALLTSYNNCRDYRLRVILCVVDVEDSVKVLHELNRMALLESCTLILAWSLLEAAR